uniref:Uncharacterized protein n=1 Tax=Trichogramma kaykai TaxID=54128 RepID=A0ABD2WKD8_9HYME
MASLGFTDLAPLPGAWLAVKSAMSSDRLLDYLSATLLLWGDRVWNAKSTAVAAVSGSSPRTLKIQERATWNSRAGSYPYPQQVSKVNSL